MGIHVNRGRVIRPRDTEPAEAPVDQATQKPDPKTAKKKATKKKD